MGGGQGSEDFGLQPAASRRQVFTGYTVTPSGPQTFFHSLDTPIRIAWIVLDAQAPSGIA